MHRTQHLVITSVISALCLTFVLDANATNRRSNRRARPTTFKGFAQELRLPHAEHGGKLFIAVKAADKTKMQQNLDKYTAIGDNKVLEFTGTGHLHTRFNGNKDANFLSGLSTYGSFGLPWGKRTNVVVKLTDAEHRELNAYVDAATRNSREAIGSFEYNGGRPNRYYPRSNPKANCTSWISSAKLGEQGQTLARLAGVWEAASPTGWIGSLARNGNSRVEAVMLHGFEGNINSFSEVQRFMSDTIKKH